MVGDESVNDAWGDPPPAGRGSGRRHAPIAEELKNRPGEWRRLDGYLSSRSSGSMAHTIRKGLLPAYEPAGAFEAVSRFAGSDYFVYVRYVGGSDA